MHVPTLAAALAACAATRISATRTASFTAVSTTPPAVAARAARAAFTAAGALPLYRRVHREPRVGKRRRLRRRRRWR